MLAFCVLSASFLVDHVNGKSWSPRKGGMRVSGAVPLRITEILVRDFLSLCPKTSAFLALLQSTRSLMHEYVNKESYPYAAAPSLFLHPLQVAPRDRPGQLQACVSN